MKPFYFFLLLLIAAIGASATGYWIHYYQRSTPQLALAIQRPDFQLPDLQGKIRKNTEWDGKIVIINFWATWCPPCVAEIPIFVKMQNQYGKQGVQFVGIAIDQLDAVQSFAEKMKINYPTLIGSEQAVEVSRDFGNDLGALPFTVIVNQQGEIVLRHRGEIDRPQIEQVILPLLKASAGLSSLNKSSSI
jgi:thiol-disulfide isomerase/thioredoxin